MLAVWLQHDTGGGDRPLRTGDGEPLGLDELPGKLSELLRELASASLEALGELTIEFVLPDELLSHPVDQWEVTPMGFSRELGMEYPVVVRSLERVRNSLTRGRWRRRWSWLQRNGAHDSAVQWLHLGAVDQASRSTNVRPKGLEPQPSDPKHSRSKMDLPPFDLWKRSSSRRIQALFSARVAPLLLPRLTHSALDNMSRHPSGVRVHRRAHVTQAQSHTPNNSGKSPIGVVQHVTRPATPN
ncbi:VMAP-C domain-containing protein [Longispora fulva]|uniref:VMAP-C domain-containing protein n=1 Tax=Longispora fulva TaxID=619741 RepID=UPI0022AC1D31|nr:hypothetical protein [Longispora fulva]